MRQSAMRKFVFTLPVAAAVATTLTWSTDSQACSSEPFIGSLCVMAWPRSVSFGGGMYMPANGTVLNVQSYTALYAVIGGTYGGNGSTTFALPNLNGRVVIGAGINPDTGMNFAYGQKGVGRITLTAAQAPQAAHAHTLNAGATKPAVATAAIGTLAANTSLAGLTATTSLSGVTASADGTKLVLKAYNGAAGTGSPTGAVLAMPAGPNNKIYNSTTPDVAMASSSITGSAPVSFTGNPVTTIAGTPTTSLTGAPAVALSGTTDAVPAASASQPVDLLPPYLPMSYYIAVTGLFPVVD